VVWSVALCLACLGGSSSLLGDEQEELPPGPGTRSLYVLDLPFLHFAPQRRMPNAGHFEVSFETAYANTFSHSWHPKAIHEELGRLGQAFTRDEAEELHLRHGADAIFFLDAEVTRLALRGAFGFGSGVAVAIEVPWLAWSALSLDTGIENFHQLVGLGSAQREAFARSQFVLVRQKPGGALEFDDRRPENGLGDATIALLFRRPLRPTWRFGAELTVKLPTGSASNYRGSGSFDAGLLIDVERSLGSRDQGTLRLEIAGVIPGRFREGGPLQLEVAPYLRASLLSQLRIGRSTWVSLSVTYEESPLRREATVDWASPAMEIALGLSQGLARGVRADLSLTENVPRFGDAPDIAIVLGLVLSK
jgi:hypothetical protein